MPSQSTLRLWESWTENSTNLVKSLLITLGKSRMSVLQWAMVCQQIGEEKYQ